MRNEPSPEFCMLVLVHLREIEVIFEQLLAHLLPQPRLTSPQHLTNVRTVSPVIADQISVQLSGYWSCESVVEEERVEDTHTHKVKS